MNRLDGWIDIARAGTWRDMQHQEITLTPARFDTMIAQFATQSDGVPVVVGHPETDAPAYGWIAELRRQGDRLQAKLRDLMPAFRTAVEQRRFAGRSIALAGDKLRHLAFLGGRAPAIPGLEPAQFAAPADCTVVFAAGDNGTVEGGEAALAVREAMLAVREARSRCARMVDAHIETGRVLPAERDLVMQLAERLEGDSETVCFSASGETETVSPLEAFGRFLGALPERIIYRRLSSGSIPDVGAETGNRTDARRAAQEAQALIEKARREGRTLSPLDAVRQVNERRNTQ